MLLPFFVPIDSSGPSHRLALAFNGSVKRFLMKKFIPRISMIVVQLGGTILFMECVRRDLFLALGFSASTGVAAYLLASSILNRTGSQGPKPEPEL
jgi:hypothetical protein